jgi:hypothetical protein
MNISIDELTAFGLVVTGVLESMKPWIQRYIKDSDMYKLVVMMLALVVSMGVAVVNAEGAEMLLGSWRSTFTLSPEVWSFLDTFFLGFLIFVFNIFGHKLINAMGWFEKPKLASASPVTVESPSTTIISSETTVSKSASTVDNDPMAQG